MKSALKKGAPQFRQSGMGKKKKAGEISYPKGSSTGSGVPSLSGGFPVGSGGSVLVEATRAVADFLAYPEEEGALLKLMSRVGEASGQDRFYLLQVHANPETGKRLIRQRFEWIRPGLESRLQRPVSPSPDSAFALPERMALLEKGEVEQGLVSELTPAEREFMDGKEVHSFLRVPVYGRKGLWGLVGFDNCTNGKIWESHDPTLLRYAADLVGISVMRQFDGVQMGSRDAKFRQLFTQLPNPMLILDMQSKRFTDANEAALRMLEMPDMASLVQREPAEISPDYQPDRRRSKDKAGEMIGWALERGWNRFEWTHRTLTGKDFPVEVVLIPMDIEGKRCLAVVWQDISERVQHRADAQVRLAALDAAANAVVITDTHGRILWTNEAFTRITGYSREEAQGQNPRLLKSGRHDAVFYKNLWETVRAGRVWQGEIFNRKKDGSLYEEEMTITPVAAQPGGPVTHYISVKTEITEKKRLQDQLLRSQRSESLGTLAGGIAHDLNNILLPITLATDVLKAKQTESDTLSLLDTISTCTKRAADMVRQVLSYARGVEGRRVEVQFRHLVREMEKIIKETFPRNISIAVHLPARLPLVEGDPTQIQQVLMNLCINARDAMPTGGTITLTVRSVFVDESLAVQHNKGRCGDFVLIEVEDTGEGIKPEIMERLFEPFFTTKELGKGTGLGLSTVQSIVHSHHGFLAVSSRLHHGSRFQVYLPSLVFAAQEQLPVEENAPPRGQGELVMVVDDEKDFCHIARQILESHGYRCLVAHDGAEAVSLYASHRFEIKLVLTDIMMPLMDGSQMIQVIKRINPEVRIISSSGHATEERLVAVASAGSQFLPKPYESGKLLRKIREVLDEGTLSNGNSHPPVV
jgi:two-component system, cell cycle sensor histidine kinase and response regulator CckA